MGRGPLAGRAGHDRPALILVFAFSVSWIWTALGLALRSAQAVTVVSFAVQLPLTFASNVFVRPATLPGWLRSFVDVNPVSHLVTAERALMNGTPAGSQADWVLLASAALIAVFGPLTMRLYRADLNGRLRDWAASAAARQKRQPHPRGPGKLKPPGQRSPAPYQGPRPARPAYPRSRVRTGGVVGVVGVVGAELPACAWGCSAAAGCGVAPPTVTGCRAFRRVLACRCPCAGGGAEPGAVRVVTGGALPARTTPVTLLAGLPWLSANSYTVAVAMAERAANAIITAISPARKLISSRRALTAARRPDRGRVP